MLNTCRGTTIARLTPDVRLSISAPYTRALRYCSCSSVTDTFLNDAVQPFAVLRFQHEGCSPNRSHCACAIVYVINDGKRSVFRKKICGIKLKVRALPVNFELVEVGQGKKLDDHFVLFNIFLRIEHRATYYGSNQRYRQRGLNSGL